MKQLNKDKIAKWKKPIIRWSLRQLKPLLPVLQKCNYEKLSEFGIGDLMVEPNTKDVALFISED